MTTTRRTYTDTQPLQPKAAQSEAVRLKDIGAEAHRLVQESKAPNTRRAYRPDFTEWCAKYGRCPLIPIQSVELGTGMELGCVCRLPM